MANDIFIDGAGANILSRSEGFILIAFFILFLVYTFGIAKTTPEEAASEDMKVLPVWKSIAYIMF
jgi:cation:H+ antiporter